MDTHDLIEKLSNDVKPVKRLASPGIRASVLTAWALALVFLVLRIVHLPRPDLAEALARSDYLLDGFMMFLAGVLAAQAALILGVPDTRIRKPVRVNLAIASAIWGTLILTELSHTKGMPEAAPSCFYGLTLGMAAPLALGLVMMLRSAPVWRGWAGFAMVLAVGSFAALGMRFICPNDSPGHLLVWHFLPVIMFALIGVPAFQILLKLALAKK